LKKVVITQSGEVLLASGEIKVEVNDVLENVTQGKQVQAGSILFIEDSAELNIAYEDGTVFYQGEIEQIVDDNEVSDVLSVNAEISQLQDLISDAQDLTTQLPETAAGSGVNNEGGSDFISVGRTGDETIAEAGYSTAGSNQEGGDTTKGIDGSDVDEPSTLENDSNTIAEDSVATGNVLDNDTDVDSTLSVVGFEVDGSTYSAGTSVTLDDGSLVINSDGSYTFTPNENWSGTVPTVTYTVNTGSSATLNIVVTPVDDASILADDSNTIAEDTVATGNVLDNDSDIDNDLSVVSFEVDGNSYSAGTSVTLDDGSLVINSDGSYTFTPNENWNGTVPTVTYTVNTGSSATLTIVVTPVDDASVLADDSNTIPEDTVATGNVLDNDADIDNDLSVVSFEVEGSTYSTGTSVTLDDGSLVINSDGSYTFTPDENWNGTVPVITYTVSTGSSATLTIVVTPVDDASVLADDSNTIPEDTVATGNVLDNDADIDNDLSVVSFEAEGNTYSAGTSVTLEDGSLVINSDGSYVFTPNDDWNGTVPVITYTVNTGSTADLNIIVTPVNDDFTDNNEIHTLAEDSPQVGGNVIDGVSVDGEITVTNFTIAGDNTTYQADGSDISISNVGTFSLDSQGNYTFTPAANYNGSVPVITYNLTDGSSGDSSTLTISVTPVNDDFTDNNEIRTLAEDSPQVGGNVIDGTSVDGDITVTSFTVTGDNTTYQADGSDIDISNVGTFSLDSHGNYTFTPTANYNGSVPVITYDLTDGSSGDSSTLSLIVTPVSDDFTDNNEVRTIAEDSPQVGGNVIDGASVDGQITVTSFTLEGDSTVYQADGSDITISHVGTFSLDSQGNYTFTPAANYNGSVPVISYNLTDGSSSDTSTLSIIVSPDADPFIDGDEAITIGEDSGATTGTLLEGSSSIEGPLSIQSFSVDGQNYDFSAGNSVTVSLSEGELTIDSDGTYSFTPATNYNGSVPVVDYTVSDGLTTNDSSLKITVTPEADPFVDGDEAITIGEDSGATTGTLLEGSSSIEGPLSIQSFSVDGQNYDFSAGNSVTVSLSEGELTIDSDGGYRFTPASNYNGQVPVVNYTVSDGLTTNDSSLKITVTPEADPFVDGDETITIGEDSGATTGTLLEGSSSIEGPLSIDSFSVAGQSYDFSAGNSVTVSLSEGELTIDSDGGYSFTPATNYNGSVPVVDYTVSDGLTTNDSSLKITVTPEADPFVDGDETITIGEDSGATTGTLLEGSSSIEGPLSIQSFSVAGQNYDFSAGNSVTVNLTAGELTIDSDGGYSFTPATNYNGSVPVVDYTVSDGLTTNDSSLKITVTPEADPFVDGDEAITIEEDSGTTSGSLLTGSTSIEGPLSIDNFSVDGKDYDFSGGSSVTVDLSSGELIIGSDGSYSFTPATDWNGDVPVVNYTVSDGETTNDSTLTIKVTPMSDAPITSPDSIDVSEGQSTQFSEASLLVNDDDFDAGSLSIVSFATDSSGSDAITATAQGASFTTALGGTVTINPDGSYSYQAPASLDHSGEDNLTDSFFYQSTDGVENSLWTQVTVNIADTAPVANDDTDSIGFGGTAHGNVITAVGTDGTGVDTLGADSASISSVSYKGASYSDFDANGNVTITTDDGILVINQDGNYSYQSTLNEFINLDSSALFDGNGVQLYGFNKSTDFVNGNDLNKALLTGKGDGTYEYNDQVGTGNNEWIERGESLVIDLEASFNEVSLGLNGWAGNANSADGQWSAYDSDGHLVASGSFSGSDSLSINSGQAYQYVVITAGDTFLSLTSVQTAVVHPLTSDQFEYVLTDADGDSSAATLTIDQDSNPQASNDSASVAESGLASGTTAGDGSNITTGNLLDNDSGVSSSTHISDVEGYTAVNGVITVTTDLGELTVYSQDSGEHRAGDYEYKLTANSTDGDNATESFDYTITNSLGSNDSASLTVNISDDAPVAHDISQNLQSSGAVVTTNLTLVLDVSGSMGDPVGNGQTYLEVAIDALTTLINEVDSTGNVNIQIVNFHANAYSSGWLIDDVAGAINYLESLVADAATYYDSALNAVMNSGPLPAGADQSLLYFISDGAPSAGHEVSSTVQSTWESYLETSGYKSSFGIGIGSAGLDHLLPVAYPEVDGDEAYAVKLDNPEDLASTILDYFDGDTIKGSYTTGVVFGADGGHIDSITVDDVTHQYDGANPVQIFMTSLGGKFTINFDTGEYSYSIEVDRDVLNEHESMVAVVKDGDGDMASVTLNLGIDYHANLDANSNNIITNLAEGTTIDIPVEYLLHGDKTVGNAGITQVSGDNVTLNGGVVTLSSTTEDSSFNYTLKGSSDKGEDSTHVDLDYAQQLIGTAENDIIINSGNGQVMPNDALITAIVTPGENSRVDNPLGFKFASNSDGLSVTSVSVNLRGGSDKDAFIENYALGDSIGLNPSDSVFTLSEGNSVITANFAEGDFTSGDEFWFTLDTSLLNNNDSNVFSHQAVTFTVTLSDGSEKTGIYLAHDGGAQTKMVFGDVLDGGAGDDVLVGGSGSDILLGGDGEDMMIGGLGDDWLSGGSGADTFIWAAGSEGTDHITDFNLNEDKLDLSDLLQGENADNLDEYLNFSVDSVTHSTTIDIDADGDGTFEQHIVLDGVDLKAEFGSTDGQIINGLLGEGGDGALIIDTQGESAAALSTGTGSLHSMDDEQVFHAIP